MYIYALINIHFPPLSGRAIYVLTWKPPPGPWPPSRVSANAAIHVGVAPGADQETQVRVRGATGWTREIDRTSHCMGSPDQLHSKELACICMVGIRHMWYLIFSMVAKISISRSLEIEIHSQRSGLLAARLIDFSICVDHSPFSIP